MLNRYSSNHTIHATYLCNEYGIDTISAGAIIAFSMECYENGVIKKKDIGDLDLSWGNPDALPELVMRTSSVSVFHAPPSR